VGATLASVHFGILASTRANKPYPYTRNTLVGPSFAFTPGFPTTR
jgi:hypothetical protein